MAPLGDLPELIGRMLHEGGSANRVVLTAADGWLLLTAQPGSAKATVQVPDGRHLVGRDPLPDALLPDLIAAGFRRRSAADPWVAERAAADTERNAAEAIDLLARLFGGPTAFDLQLGIAPRVENQPLLDKMREAGRAQDPVTRNRLYHALVRARFVVPLTAPAPPGGTLALRPAGELHGEPVSAVFTDWDTFIHHDPRGLPATVLPGLEVFPLLAHHRFVSVLVNPGGQVGGELYRHEIDTLAEGCRRLVAMGAAGP